MRLSAVLLLFREQHFIAATYQAIYPVVDSICVATQYDRNLAGKSIVPDQSVARLLSLPDPENKLRLVVQRQFPGEYQEDAAAQLRNVALKLDPVADYYLIVDSDEIWPTATLRRAWAEVQRTRFSAYRVNTRCYFRSWNFQVVEKPPGYRSLAFLRRGFAFLKDRQVQWHGPARWKEYLRLGRKPKTVYFAPEIYLHHGSGVGDDQRILTKLQNYSHADGVDPAWFENVWKNFSAETKNFHYFKGGGALYESILPVATTDLPLEITSQEWPEGWIDRRSAPLTGASPAANSTQR